MCIGDFGFIAPLRSNTLANSCTKFKSWRPLTSRVMKLFVMIIYEAAIVYGVKFTGVVRRENKHFRSKFRICVFMRLCTVHEFAAVYLRS